MVKRGYAHHGKTENLFEGLVARPRMSGHPFIFLSHRKILQTWIWNLSISPLDNCLTFSPSQYRRIVFSVLALLSLSLPIVAVVESEPDSIVSNNTHVPYSNPHSFVSLRDSFRCVIRFGA